MTFICFLPKCVGADAPVNINHAPWPPVFVFSFVNQRTFPSLILNTMLLVHAAVSLMLQGYRLFGHACHLLWHFLHQLWNCSNTVSLCETSTCSCALRRCTVCGCQRGASKRLTRPRKNLWNEKLKRNPLLRASPWIMCSYQLLQDETLSIQQPQPPPTSHINAAHLHTEPWSDSN